MPARDAEQLASGARARRGARSPAAFSPTAPRPLRRAPRGRPRSPRRSCRRRRPARGGRETALRSGSSAECTSSRPSSPGQAGTNATLLYPAATTTRSAPMLAVRCLRDPAAVAGVDRAHLDAAPDLQPVVRGVGAQVVHDLVAGGPPAGGAWDRQAGEARQPTHRVQVEAVVARGPHRPDLEAFEDDDLLACGLQHRGGREAGRTGADHEDHPTVIAHGGGRHHPLALEAVGARASGRLRAAGATARRAAAAAGRRGFA